MSYVPIVRLHLKKKKKKKNTKKNKKQQNQPRPKLDGHSNSAAGVCCSVLSGKA